MLPTLEAIRAALLGSFYKNLAEGKIRDAMRAVQYINTQLNYVAENLPVYATEMKPFFPKEIEVISNNWGVLKSLSAQLNDKINEHLRIITEEDVMADPEIFTRLLREEFVKIIKDMAACIRTIIRQIKIIQKKSKIKPLPTVKYTEKYLRLKQNKNTYVQNTRIIDRTEQKVREFLRDNRLFEKAVTQRILTGPWAGHLHAYLSDPIGNHRVVYLFYHEKNTVEFEILGTHKELGID
ncbi:hypothetical protein GF343_03725 [Candidatus Woesearchaeota archaeon]|nr:hypothetical protein [Candidatus Woesearchaeota archaeon]